MHALRLHIVASISALALAATATTATAHIAVGSGPAAANRTQKITFAITHGCGDLDTLRIRIDIPAGITSVRPLASDFGKPIVARTGTAVTSVTWQKPDADLQDADVQFYELTIRARVADVPFTQIQFNIFQTCRDADGNEITVPWDQPPGSTSGEPAAMLTVVPGRLPGWNRVVAPIAIAEADLGRYFGDALIVWRGTAAFSANPNTMSQIAATPGVTVLAGDIAPGDELWVRY
jgi:periplasmic copper chaperone A